jgi:ATP-dependent protease HslVU (ClpYQ) peptidase subunit
MFPSESVVVLNTVLSAAALARDYSTKNLTGRTLHFQDSSCELKFGQALIEFYNVSQTEKCYSISAMRSAGKLKRSVLAIGSGGLQIAPAARCIERSMTRRRTTK